MLTKQQVLEEIRKGRKNRESCELLDGRDYARLTNFFEDEYLSVLGFEKTAGATREVKEWTFDNVLGQLTEDLDFAFLKALNRRGISSSLMYEVVKMWMWVLEDDLQYFEEYAQYGLPLYKAVAVKYRLPNPIGDDTGTERKYASGL